MAIDLPDFLTENVIKGYDGTVLRTIRVSETGEMYILLSAFDGVTITPLKCDEFGNAFLNVKAQDLAEVINRPKYGEAESGKGQIGTVAIGDVGITIWGKGVVYGGHIEVDKAVTHKDDYAYLKPEFAGLDTLTLEEMNDRQIYRPGMFPFWLQSYDEVNYYYVLGISPGITFETRMDLGYHSDVAPPVMVNYYIVFALV